MAQVVDVKRQCVLQDWVQELTLMQQSVLISTVRGPDGIRKDHVAKLLLRWLRRNVLLSAFDGTVLEWPNVLGGGSFTGPSINARTSDELENPEYCAIELTMLGRLYLNRVDELPHHFQLHLMHAAEILGYKHPVAWVRAWWYSFYLSIVNDAHLFPESEALMDQRLGDTEAGWRAREEVIARPPCK